MSFGSFGVRLGIVALSLLGFACASDDTSASGSGSTSNGSGGQGGQATGSASGGSATGGSGGSVTTSSSGGTGGGTGPGTGGSDPVTGGSGGGTATGGAGTGGTASGGAGVGGGNAAECTVDAECTLYSNYCEPDACTCVPLSLQESPPPCNGMMIPCFVDPCLNKDPKCLLGQCVAQ